MVTVNFNDILYSLLKMGRQPAQRATSSGNLTVSLPSENVLFLLTTRRKEKKKIKPKEQILSPKGKSLNIIQKS